MKRIEPTLSRKLFAFFTLSLGNSNEYKSPKYQNILPKKSNLEKSLALMNYYRVLKDTCYWLHGNIFIFTSVGVGFYDSCKWN